MSVNSTGLMTMIIHMAYNLRRADQLLAGNRGRSVPVSS